MKDIKGSMESLGLYIATMFIGSLIHGIVVLPTVYFVILRRNPFRLLARMSQALLTAFGTASR
jgi:Na+/H+-dicarboxylate symporter